MQISSWLYKSAVEVMLFTKIFYYFSFFKNFYWSIVDLEAMCFCNLCLVPYSGNHATCWSLKARHHSGDTNLSCGPQSPTASHKTHRWPLSDFLFGEFWGEDWQLKPKDGIILHSFPFFCSNYNFRQRTCADLKYLFWKETARVGRARLWRPQRQVP